MRPRLAFLSCVALWSWVGHAHGSQSTACDALVELMQRAERDYRQMERLQDNCEHDLKNNPESQILRSLQQLELAEVLSDAHKRRLLERERIVVEARAALAPLRGASSAAIAALSDGYFVGAIAHLNGLRLQLSGAGKRPYRSYLNRSLSTVIDLAQPERRSVLTTEAADLVQSVQTKVAAYAARSDVELSGTDKKVDAALHASLTALSKLRASATYVAAQRVNDEILTAISAQILALDAMQARERFVVQSHVSTLMTRAQIKINTGLVASGLSILDSLDRSRASFEAKLPARVRTALEKAGVESWVESSAMLRKFAHALTDEQIDMRLQQFIRMRITQYSAARTECLRRFPSQAARLVAIDDVMKEGIELTALPANAPLKRFAQESLAERLDIAVALCLSART